VSKYVKNSSPQQTAAVCRNLLEAMEANDLQFLDRETLRSIVVRCNAALERRTS
jgi:hypothetical protein